MGMDIQSEHCHAKDNRQNSFQNIKMTAFVIEAERTNTQINGCT